MTIAMTVALDTSGLISKLRKMTDRIPIEAKQAIADVTLKVEGDAKYAIQTGGRSGRIYKRGSITHQSSASSEFPKTDTGQLVSNITSEFTLMGLEATVGSRRGAPHGFMLEFGTSKMAPRPWLMPTLYKNKQYIDRRFEKSLKEIARYFI